MMIIGPRQLLDLTTCREQTDIFSLVVFWHSLITAEKTVAIVPNVPIVQSLRSFQAVEDNGLGGESRLISPRRLPEREV
jgi:hypothetical protein